MGNRFGQEAEVLLREHEHESQNWVEGLVFSQLYLHVPSRDVVVDIAKKRSVMEGIIPGP